MPGARAGAALAAFLLLALASSGCQSIIGLQGVPPLPDAAADGPATDAGGDVAPPDAGDGAPVCRFDSDAATVTFDNCVFQ